MGPVCRQACLLRTYRCKNHSSSLHTTLCTLAAHSLFDDLSRSLNPSCSSAQDTRQQRKQQRTRRPSAAACQVLHAPFFFSGPQSLALLGLHLIHSDQLSPVTTPPHTTPSLSQTQFPSLSVFPLSSPLGPHLLDPLEPGTSLASPSTPPAPFLPQRATTLHQSRSATSPIHPSQRTKTPRHCWTRNVTLVGGPLTLLAQTSHSGVTLAISPNSLPTRRIPCASISGDPSTKTTAADGDRTKSAREKYTTHNTTTSSTRLPTLESIKRLLKFRTRRRGRLVGQRRFSPSS